MLHLIKKDLVMHKLAWFTFLAMLIFFMLFDKNQIFVIALMSAVVMTNAFYYEEDINGHKLWNALPYTRNEIVSARYSSLLIVFFCYCDSSHYGWFGIKKRMGIRIIARGNW